MKISTKFRWLSLIFAVSLLLVTAIPASANTLYKNIIPWNETWTWLGSENPCGFDIVYQVQGEIRLNYWLDDNGDFVRAHESYGTTRATVSANNKSMGVRMQGPIIYRVEDNDAIMIILGPNWLFIAPGYGNVIGATGLEIDHYTINPDTGEWENYTVVKLVGNVNWEDWSQFCEYLGG